MTEQPQPGNHVTVTTQTLTGGRSSETGIYQPASTPDAFHLDGEVMASPAFIRQHHGASRTIIPTP